MEITEIKTFIQTYDYFYLKTKRIIKIIQIANIHCTINEERDSYLIFDKLKVRQRRLKLTKRLK